MKKYLNILIIGAVVCGVLLPISTEAAQCVFTRTLELGSTGEDVRCLQKFLNENGFIIASTGVGSPGNETNLYREKTIEAVKKWQQSKEIFPATGNFGPLSKEKYNEEFTVAAKPTTEPITEAVPATTPTQTTLPARVITTLPATLLRI